MSVTYRWNPEDFSTRIDFAEKNYSSDLFTKLIRTIIPQLLIFCNFILNPINKISHAIGRLLTKLILGLLVLAIFDLIWLLFWLIIIGLSKLWIKFSLLRPLLFIPSIIIIPIANIYILLAPDPHKYKNYWIILKLWPVTSIICLPPKEYFDLIKPKIIKPNKTKK